MSIEIFANKTETGQLDTDNGAYEKLDVISAISALSESSGERPELRLRRDLRPAAAFPANTKAQLGIMDRSFGQPLFDRSFAN